MITEYKYRSNFIIKLLTKEDTRPQKRHGSCTRVKLVMDLSA
jgi:hypothetical protein